MPTLTPKAFELLMSRLDSDESKAAEMYEDLRLKLTRCLTWKKNCPESQADALVDETFDRIAVKLAQGVEIENFYAYAHKVLNFVWLEHRNKYKEDGYDDETTLAVSADAVFPEDPDIRLACLRSCLVEVAKDDKERRLILDYYDTEEGEKLKNRRKTLAERLGLKINALKVRASRLRAKLEICINECVRKRLTPVTKT